MIEGNIFQSIKLSFQHNGIAATMSLIFQYFQLKASRKEVFKFRFTQRFGDIYLRPRTSDFSTFRQVFMDDEYGIEFSEPPFTIVDAGANIGLSALYFSQRFPMARIIALEPDRSNFEILTLNTQMRPLIIPLNYALWNENKMLAVVDAGRDKWGIQVQHAETNSSQLVQAVNLEHLMSNYEMKQIDLLKIDVEGAEWELFQSNFHTWLPRVKVLVIELHEHLRPGCNMIFNNAIKSIPHRVSHKGENVIIYNLGLQ